jgi:hypothetical protein
MLRIKQRKIGAIVSKNAVNTANKLVEKILLSTPRLLYICEYFPRFAGSVPWLTQSGLNQRHRSIPCRTTFLVTCHFKVFYRACDAASSIRAATSFGLET